MSDWDALGPTTDHREARRVLEDAGWAQCGAGDWAWALRSPDGEVVARVCPFDPTGPLTARFYREAAGTGQVPRVLRHAALEGGGDLLVLEHLVTVPEEDAAAFHALVTAGAPEVGELVAVLRRVHQDGLRELPWCGPIDTNPSNVMARADGRLVLLDPFYADGPRLFAAAEKDTAAFVQTIPAEQRRHMTEIPVTSSGPWAAEDRERLRQALAAADRRRL